MHDVGIEHPAHDLRARVDVGAGHVAVGAEQVDHLGHVAARQPLALALRQRARIDDDAALRAAHGNADDGALERHPERERFDLVDRNVLMKTDAALGRTARHVVLHAKRAEIADRAVVHAHGQQHLRRAPRQLDHRDLILGQLQTARGRIELVERVLERRRMPFLERACDLAATRGGLAFLAADAARLSDFALP